jgi:hypothetical protein
MAESSMLSDATIQELKQILKEEYGRNVDLKEVSKIAHTLVGYFDLLAKIRHREKVKNKYDDDKITTK